MTTEALRGKRILVTRAREQSSSLQRLLEEAGANVIAIPAIEIVPPDSFDSLDQALRHLADNHHARYDWLVFTSANAVHAMQRRAQQLNIALNVPAALSIAAIGNATADALRAAGLPVHLVPPVAVAESLAESLAPLAAGRRILLVRAKEGRNLLPAALTTAGAIVTIAVAYKSVLPPSSIDQLRAISISASTTVDAITFTSASSVHNLATLAAAAGLQLKTVRKVSIGPITTAALAEYGWHADAEAATASIEALVAACADALDLRA